jgi:hypothetical protein
MESSEQTVDCTRIRETVLSGNALSEAERGHAATCAACRAVALDGGNAARRLWAVASEEADLGPLRAAIERDVGQKERGVVWLRSRPTSVRLGFGVVLCLGILLLTLVLMPRPDIEVYPALRMLLVTSTLLVLLGVAVSQGLRPLQQAGIGAHGLLLVLALLVPMALAALPAAHSAHALSLGGVGPSLIPRAFACFVFGVALGLPLLVSMRALDRLEHATVARALWAAAATGLLGNLTLSLHCPLTHPAHLLLGHASVGIAVAAAYGLLARGRL